MQLLVSRQVTVVTRQGQSSGADKTNCRSKDHNALILFLCFSGILLLKIACRIALVRHFVLHCCTTLNVKNLGKKMTIIVLKMGHGIVR